MNEHELLEQLADLEHQQWMSWVKHILKHEDISAATKQRWEKSCVPYGDLPNQQKELDRMFARKSLAVFKEYLKRNK